MKLIDYLESTDAKHIIVTKGFKANSMHQNVEYIGDVDSVHPRLLHFNIVSTRIAYAGIIEVEIDTEKVTV